MNEDTNITRFQKLFQGIHTCRDIIFCVYKTLIQVQCQEMETAHDVYCRIG